MNEYKYENLYSISKNFKEYLFPESALIPPVIADYSPPYYAFSISYVFSTGCLSGLFSDSIYFILSLLSNYFYLLYYFEAKS